MELKTKILTWLDEHETELCGDVMKLCRINSERGEAKEGRPFGDGPYEALNKALELCSSYGLLVKNYDNYVMAADLNKGEACLDILAHMDVVAAGEGWTVTSAYEPVIKDGKIYARGSSDDKGPAVAALYGLRAIKELDIPVTKNCRLILGSDEECGMTDVKHYYSIEKEAPMTFSPDSSFPVTNVEKGHFGCEISASFEKSEYKARLLEINSGTTINIVPGRGYAIVTGLSKEEIEAVIDEVSSYCKVEFKLSSEGDNIRIEAMGEASHAANPDGGKNAAMALIRLVNRLPLPACEQLAFLKRLEKLFPYGDNKGEALGIKMEDELSGPTTVSPDILRVDEEHLSLKFDSRTCVAADEENTVAPAKAKIEAEGFSADCAFGKPHVVPADTDFIKTLLSCYEAVKGEKGYTESMGGGTYVHDLKNGVAFGAVSKDLDTHMHGPDEFMPISDLKTAAAIYALCIAELCK